jgi:hypothetical protein
LMRTQNVRWPSHFRQSGEGARAGIAEAFIRRDRGAEVFGVPAEAVATELVGCVCEVLAGEKRFSVSDELYFLEDMTARNYLLVVA